MAKNTPKTDVPEDIDNEDTLAGTGSIEDERPPAPPKPSAPAIDNMKRPAAKPGGFAVYLGPSIVGAIISGTVFATDRQTTLKELKPVIDKYPLVASLIVTGAELHEARLKVKTPGNLLYANYNRFVGQLKSM